jgi:hypothetical protein
MLDQALKTAWELSIPQWCDCCGTALATASQLAIAFNPTMVRLLLDGIFVFCVEKFCFQSHNGAIAA